MYKTTMMNNNKVVISALMALFVIVSLKASGQEKVSESTLKYYDGQSLTVIGRFHSEKNYRRFPAEYEKTLRKEVWSLGQNSAGISIRFCTNSSVIRVRWTATNNFSMDHMASTGVKGLDLYALINNKWQYVGTGRVRGKENEHTIIQTDKKVYREYLLNLPLYDGIDSLSIGVDNDSELSIPKENYLVAKKPVVYYGTSIAQGGCASRPGLAFTNILSRKLDRPFINMGFSGNGNCELSVGEAMCESDAALFVLDCNPNTKTDEVYDRTVKLVTMLKEKRPEVPVLLVESIYFENILSPGVATEPVKKNAELRRAYKSLRESGIKNLYYKKSDGMIGTDHEGTVDGAHPNDLGMMRMAESLEPVIRKLVK